MLANVLVVDQTEEFGALIRNALEETGQYQVALAINAAEALEIGEKGDLQLLVIDFGLSDIDAPTCIQRIQNANPDIVIIAIPPNNDPNDPILSSLPINGLLTKPFYLPELNKIVSEALGQPPHAKLMKQIGESVQQENKSAQVSEKPTSQLDDTDRASRHLTMLCNETSAEAMILLRHGQAWAQAGEISPAQAEDIASKITEFGVGEGTRGAITTVTRLQGAQRDCTLYANVLLQDWILAMIYLPGTSFGVIRHNAKQAADLLKQFELVSNGEDSPSEEISVSETAPISLQAQEDDTSDWSPNVEPVVQEMPFLDDLDLPPPEPDDVTPQIPESQTQIADSPAGIPGDWVPEKAKPESHLPFLEDRTISAAEPAAQARIPLPDAEYYLPVSAILVPRFPEHRLIDELAENLQEWVVRLCLAWDWRADEVTIEPDYLCLTMSISPETAPSNAVERLRDDLSQRILSAFPEFVENLPSRRFWARSYLLITGGPPPTEEVQAFVQSTRKGQGIEI